jgi:phosphoenolpyruvate-protein kinase (PTS system EI component)
MAEFAAIGLVRSEYLFRAEEQYPTRSSATSIVEPYLSHLGILCPDRPIWYRTLEVTVAEANTLSGVERLYRPAGYDFLGLRGVRRSRCHPNSLRAELEAIRRAREKNNNIGVVAPFVSAPAELSWYAEMVERYAGADTPLATMLETPSAILLCDELLSCGPVVTVIVGCNDLSSLLNATSRRMGESIPLSAGLIRALASARHVTHEAGVEMVVAGYITPEIIRYCRQINCDLISLHYSDLPRLLGKEWSHLPDLDRVSRIKQLTIRRIAELSATDAIREAPSPPDPLQITASFQQD